MLNKHTVGHPTTNVATRNSITSLHHTSPHHSTQQQHLHLQIQQQQQHPNLNQAVQNQQHLFTATFNQQTTYFTSQPQPQLQTNIVNNQQQQQPVSEEQQKHEQPPRQSHLSPNDALNLGINLEQYISKRNERERSRVRNVNDAFDNLKNSLPLEAEKLTKRMSKVEILRTAISYIRNLEEILGYKQQGNMNNDNLHQKHHLYGNHHHNQYNSRQQQQQLQRTSAINELSSLLLAATNSTQTSSSTIATSTSASSSASSPAPSAGEQQVAGYYLEQQLGSPSDLMCRLHLERTNSCYTLADDQHSVGSAMASPASVYEIQQSPEQPVVYQNYLNVTQNNQHHQQQHEQQQQQQIVLQHYDRQYNCAATYSDHMRNTNFNHRQFDQFQGY